MVNKYYALLSHMIPKTHLKCWLESHFSSVQFSSVQSLSHIRLFATPWIAAHVHSCPAEGRRDLFANHGTYIFQRSLFTGWACRSSETWRHEVNRRAFLLTGATRRRADARTLPAEPSLPQRLGTATQQNLQKFHIHTPHGQWFFLRLYLPMEKAECGRIHAFELWCWRTLLRVPWTAGRSNQSIWRRSALGFLWKEWC